MIEIKATGVREARGLFGKYAQGISEATRQARQEAATAAGEYLMEHLALAGEERHHEYSGEDRHGSPYNGDPPPFSASWKVVRGEEDNEASRVQIVNTKEVWGAGGDKRWNLLSLLNAGTEEHDYPIAPVFAQMLRIPNRRGEPSGSEGEVAAFAFRRLVTHPGLEGSHFVEETLAQSAQEAKGIANKKAGETFVHNFEESD